jgi:putative transposase
VLCHTFLNRQFEYVWPDATFVIVRPNHRFVSVGVIGSTRASARSAGHGHRPFGRGDVLERVLRKLRRRGLRAVKLVVSDATKGIKAAVAKLLNGSWQRRRMDTMRNALAHAGRKYGYHQSLSLSGPKRSATIDRSQE